MEPPPHGLHLVRTGGWVCLPDWPPLRHFHPDPLAPPPHTTFISGYGNVSGLGPERRAGRGLAQYPAPFLWVDAGGEANGLRVAVSCREPGSQPGAAVARVLVQTLRPSGPGTHLHRYHPEDAGPPDAGTAGVVAVRPRQNGDVALYPSGKYAYDDGDGSTGYDREFVLVLSEIWAEEHWSRARSRLVDRRNHRADFSLLNGRVWPDTLLPSGSVDPFHPVADASGRPVAPGGNQRLRYQPYSSLVTCNAGERVLLRLANLGSRTAILRIEGVRVRVVGRDAALVRGRGAAGGRSGAHALPVRPGQLVDAIFTAPPHSGREGPDRHALENVAGRPGERGAGAGGQRTEVRVHPASGPGALPPQALPHS